ncbi:hypothetical protein [Pseudokineococcus sp. 1T1Z-3]|uniref:hypothetical protein n=1 Tax=Pseudokineococcus sp. 1T1Z-3 TaxID=3132745 RepID=UPI003099A372
MSERGQGRGEDPVDVDAAWAEIVARWEQPPGSRPAGERGSSAGDGARPVVEDQQAPPEAAPAAEDGSAADAAAEGTPDADAAAEQVSDPPAADEATPEPAPAPTPAPRGWADDAVAGDRRPTPREPEPEPEDHFVPPPLPPTPPVTPLVRAAWVGALGGPALLLVCALVWRDAPTLVVVAGVAAFVAGFAVLVSRLPRSRDEDGDDGAVV